MKNVHDALDFTLDYKSMAIKTRKEHPCYVQVVNSGFVTHAIYIEGPYSSILPFMV